MLNTQVADFVRLVVQDYLTATDLKRTLQVYLEECKEKEWKDPDPVHWYGISENLNLPDLLQGYGRGGPKKQEGSVEPIISVLVKYVMALRSKELAKTNPPVPSVKRGSLRLSRSQPVLRKRPQTAFESRRKADAARVRPINALKTQTQPKTSVDKRPGSRQRPKTAVAREKSTLASDRLDFGKIPDKQRSRILSREFQNVRKTLRDREVRDKRWQEFERRSRIEADFEEIRNESFRARNVQCMLCTQSFRAYQLKNPASYKSIMDIRAAWDPNMPEPNPVLAKPPTCYNKVNVCAFCAQFVENIEAYRPSFASRRRQERLEMLQKLDDIEREKNRLDPLQDCFDELAGEIVDDEAAPREENQVTETALNTQHRVAVSQDD